MESIFFSSHRLNYRDMLVKPMVPCLNLQPFDRFFKATGRWLCDKLDFSLLGSGPLSLICSPKVLQPVH